MSNLQQEINYECCVNNGKKIRNKSVLFELRNKNDCSYFLQTLQNNCTKFIAKIPEKRNPRIFIHGIEANFPEEELVEAIREQNPWVKQCLADPAEQLVKRFVKHFRNGRTQYAVLEVTPKLYRAVMQRGKLYTGYSSCPVKDHIYVVRCHNCSAFGHISADCNSPKQCPHCAEEHEI
jgi:rubrerythrin